MIFYARVKALTQESLNEKAIDVANEIEGAGGEVINITFYADSNSIGRNKAGSIFYRADRQIVR